MEVLIMAKSYSCNGKTVYYEGPVLPKDADVHLKIDKIERYKEHGDLYYFIKIFFTPGIKAFNRFEMFNYLLEYNNYNFDYFEAVRSYYKKHVRKFIKQNKNSIINIDCEGTEDSDMPAGLYDCIAKDMGLEYTESHIVVSSDENFGGGSSALYLLGRIKRFK